MAPSAPALSALAPVEAPSDPASATHCLRPGRGCRECLRLQRPWPLVERRCLAHEPRHSWSSRRPRPRLKTSFSFSFSRFTDSGATFSRGVRCTVTLYPRNFRLQGRATALLSRLTFSRRRSHRNFSSDSITRSPARRDCTYTLQSSAYRQKRCPRRSSSLSSSSSRTLLSNGDSGPPCGVPSRRGNTTPPSIIPACK